VTPGGIGTRPETVRQGSVVAVFHESMEMLGISDELR
jgi:hypothetical protein